MTTSTNTTIMHFAQQAQQSVQELILYACQNIYIQIYITLIAIFFCTSKLLQ